MKNNQWSILVFGFLVLASYESMTVDEQALSTDEEAILALFENDSAADVIATAAAQTAIMQQQIAVKPISSAELLMRRIWDRFLLAYLWVQAKYVAVKRYFSKRKETQSAQ